jgi:hypothetical protein
MQFKKSGIFTTFLIIAAMSGFILTNSPGPVTETAVAGDVTPDEFNYLPLIIKPAGTPTATATPLPPTATPTSSPTPADVRITLIVYNPDGDDLLGEYVRLQNFGGTTAVLTGWTLSDNDAHIYDFPGGFSLAPGAAVLVWVKSGTNDTTNLYWGSAQAYWNNTGDTAFLRNGGTLIDSCSYPGGGAQVSC